MKPLLLGLIILLMVAACAAEGAPESEPDAAAAAQPGALAPVTAAPAAANPAPERSADDAASEAAEEADAPAEHESTAAVESSIGASEPVSPVVVDLSQITPQPPTSSEPVEMPRPGRPTDGIGPIMRLVTEDAARRQGVEMERVALVAHEAITWPNAALGCPEADMMYLSVLTPGYKITLAVDGIELTYHTNEQERFVLCANGKPVRDD